MKDLSRNITFLDLTVEIVSIDIICYSEVKLSTSIKLLQESGYEMLSEVLYHSHLREINITIQSMGVMRRGDCTFVEKSKLISRHRGDFGIMVNSDDSFIDMPSGKENTSVCSATFAVAKYKDGK